MKTLKTTAIAALLALPGAAFAQGQATGCSEFIGWSHEDKRDLVVSLAMESMGAGMSDETAEEITAMVSERCDQQRSAQVMNIMAELPLAVQDEPVQE